VTDWPVLPPFIRVARVLMVGGPFDGQEAIRVPPDINAPAQLVWSGWFPWGFDAWLYEWHGEVTKVMGYTDALIFRPTGRHLGPEEIPPVVAEAGELWASSTAMIVAGFDVPAELLWPGV
jgi:hypothetical protein